MSAAFTPTGVGRCVHCGATEADHEPSGCCGDGGGSTFTPTSEWMPIETAPKDGLIDVWVDLHEGYRLADAYYDTICGQWRTSRPSNHLVCVPERHVTHWMPMPLPPVPESE